MEIKQLNHLFVALAARGLWPMSDEKYIKKRYFEIFRTELDLKSPKTFSEKIQWLKLYDRKTEYTEMVDKYAVKQYVANKIGEKYVIPTIAVWNDTEDIEFDLLPNQFVMKATHDSGGLVICKDKRHLNIIETKKKLKRCLKSNYYLKHREWPYKNASRKIIAEKYITDEKSEKKWINGLQILLF